MKQRRLGLALLAVSAALAAGLGAARAQTVQKQALGVSGGLMTDSGMRLKPAFGGFAGLATGAVNGVTSGWAALGYQPGTTLNLAGTSNSAGALTVSWSAAGQDGIVNGLAGSLNGRYRLDVSTDPAHPFAFSTFTDEVSTGAVAPGTAQFFGRSSLLGNATYFIKLFTLDASSATSDASNLASAVTRAYVPATVSTTTANISSTTVSFFWGQGNNSATTLFRVEIATVANGSPLFQSPLQTTLTFNFTGLSPATTYFARVKARNGDGLETAYTDLGSVFLPAPIVVVPPAAPQGVVGSFPGGNAFTISWLPVTKNVDGATTAMQGYRVYKTTSTSGTPSLEAFVGQSTTTLSYTDAVGAAAAHLWFVRTLDAGGNESADSMYVNSSQTAPDTVESEDGGVAFEIPKSETADLAQNQNAAVAIERLEEDEGGTVLRAYEVNVTDLSTGLEKANFEFRRALNLTFNIPSRTGLSPQGLGPTDVAVFHHNGIEFVKIGGDVNPFTNQITVSTTKPGVYQLRASLRPSEFTVTRTVPPKIFTPNGDGVNDAIDILYDNPATSIIDSAKVYDVAGAEVADLAAGCAVAAGSSCMHWNGKTRDGDKARSGIYIWQIKAENKVMNGTVVLAR